MTRPGLRIAFAGTPELAATVLDRLLSCGRHDIICVYTRPDRPAGRGRRLTPSPVKILAGARGLPVAQPDTAAAMDPEGRLGDLDVLLVVAYGVLLPVSILGRPRLGAVNVHLSLLPRWRGAAPIQRAIQAGDAETGVTIMQMDAGLDTGPILLQERCAILPEDTSGSLHDRLAILGGDCAVRALDLLAAGTLTATPQDESLATRAAKVTRQEACLDWRRPALQLARDVRAFNPWPMCHTSIAGREVRILRAGVHAAAAPVAGTTPGTVSLVGPDGIDVATGDGVLRITELQLPGRRPASARDFFNARHDWLTAGAHAGPP